MAAGSVAAPRLIPLRAPGHGRAGHEVDTATPVEMKSDSTDVQIFYTLDGSSPEAWRTVRGGENSTMRYSGALLLPPGKVSVRAVAVTRDGRQSSTMTKVFLVSANVSSLRGQEDLQDKEFGQETLQWTGRGTPSRSLLQSPADVLRSSGGARFLCGRLGPQDPQTQKSSPPTEPPRPKSLQATTSHSQSTRVQREADFLRCTRCFCDRPSDPFSRFCIHCGASLPPVPGQRLPPTEAGQMGVCFVCNTLVPVNTPSCLICEAAIPPQLRPQARIKLKDKVLCVVCGSVNPGHISHCVTCENRLVPTPAWTVAPPLPPAGDQRLACSQCQRTNNQDARFCDWCGAKPSHPLSSVLCGGCGASSHPYASYCSTCGLRLVAPPRSHASSVPARGEPPQGSRSTANGVTWRSLLSPNSSHSTSQATPARARAPPTADQQTQTVGLFYPSGAELQKTHQQRELAEQAAPRRPLLTAVSPGRGYWRQQVDHVCAHLRAYAQNNPHFRTLLGEPRMGRMATVVIKEDDFEVSLRLSFLLGGPEPQGTQASREKRAGVSPDQTQTLSSVTEGQNPGSNPTSLVKKQPAPRPKPRLQTTQKPLDGLLLDEVGPGGQGGVAVVQQLLDQGADPMCQDSEGHSVLVVAVVNGRPDIIPVLVQRGADVNQQSGPFKNTALHEAASQGSGGLQSAKVLLGCRARMKRNAQGDTPYDLSLTCGCPPMVQLLGAQLGHTLLGTLLPNPARISLEPTATASSSSSG